MRGSLWNLAIAAVGVVFAATTALADPPIGSRVSRGEQGLTKRYDPRHASSPRPAIQSYLRCAASLNRPKAREVLDLPYRSSEQIDASNEFMPKVTWGEARTQDCFSDFGGMRIGYDSTAMVGAFAEYFIDKDFDEGEVEAISRLTLDDWRSSMMQPRNASESLGMCMAQSHAGLIMTLIHTEPASRDETAAIGQVASNLGPCISDGVEAEFDKPALRALLSYGIYRTLHQAEELRAQK